MLKLTIEESDNMTFDRVNTSRRNYILDQTLLNVVTIKKLKRDSFPVGKGSEDIDNLCEYIEKYNLMDLANFKSVIVTFGEDNIIGVYPQNNARSHHLIIDMLEVSKAYNKLMIAHNENEINVCGRVSAFVIGIAAIFVMLVIFRSEVMFWLISSTTIMAALIFAICIGCAK